jgi:hypothetical protein
MKLQNFIPCKLELRPFIVIFNAKGVKNLLILQSQQEELTMNIKQIASCASAAMLAAFLILGSCTDPNGSPGGETEGGDVTVSFVTNVAGVEIEPVTVGKGGAVAKPADPSFTAAGAKNRFRGWYTDNNTFQAPYDFTSRVTKDTTLYADYGYRVGDTGPGGGKIFYRDNDGFGVTTDDSSTYTGYVAYYLEAAPEDAPSTLTWGPPGQAGGGGLPNDNVATIYKNTFGSGRRNTDAILRPARVPTSPAALACKGASFGGQNDWFLPCRRELNELYKNVVTNGVVNDLGVELGIKTTGSVTGYWSSNQFDDEFVYYRNFATGGEDTSQNMPYNVRAIRAF